MKLWLKTSPKTKFQDLTASQANFIKYLDKREHWLFWNHSKNPAVEGKLANLFYEATIILMPKPNKDTTKKNLQANKTDEHRCKNPQQNTSNSSSTVHLKDHTPWSSGIQPRDARIFQHPQANPCNTPINKLKNKNHMIISTMHKKLLTKQHPFMTTLQKSDWGHKPQHNKGYIQQIYS